MALSKEFYLFILLRYSHINFIGKSIKKTILAYNLKVEIS